MLAALVGRHRAIIGVTALAVVAALAGGIYVVLQRAEAPAPETLTTSLDAFEVAQLTTTGNAERPAISPDGRYVAYIQRDASTASLWIRQTATASNVQIVPPEAGVDLLGATVTPDGSFVDFVHFQPGSPTPSLWRVPFLGGTPRRLMDGVSSPVDWSPDGRRLAFVRANQGAGIDSLVVADPGSAGERVLASRRRPGMFYSLQLAGRPNVRPAWSPDGRTIALYGAAGSEGATQTQVVFVDTVTGAERVVTLPSETGEPQGIVWLDGQSLIGNHSGQTGAPTQLWRLSYPDGRLSRLTNDLNAYLGMGVSADRASVVTMRSEVRAGLWVEESTAGTIEEIVAPAPFFGGFLIRPTVSWAGDRIVYTTSTGTRPTIAAILPTQGRSEEIVSNGFEVAGAPDGRAVLFRSTESGRDGLWKVTVDGRQRVQLVSGHVVSPVVTPDGRFVVFVSNRRGVLSPWIVSIDGGELTQVTTSFAGATSLDVSPKGDAILFGSRDEQGASNTVVCNLPACASRRILPRLSGRMRWTPDGRAIAYAALPLSNIWIQPLDGSAPSQLTRFTDGRTIDDFAFSRDGRRLAISRTETRNDIVLFKGLK